VKAVFEAKTEDTRVMHDETLAAKSLEVERAMAAHVEALLTRHRKELAGVKEYFESITLSNLDLIKTLKKFIEDLQASKTLGHVRRLKLQNQSLLRPIRALQADALRLNKEVQAYSKETNEFETVKRQLSAVEEDYQRDSFHVEVLTQKLDMARREAHRAQKHCHQDFRARQSQREGFHSMLVEKRIER
jgi:chromosome segregation ATPase